jgi:hypothetical protein
MQFRLRLACRALCDWQNGAAVSIGIVLAIITTHLAGCPVPARRRGRPARHKRVAVENSHEYSSKLRTDVPTWHKPLSAVVEIVHAHSPVLRNLSDHVAVIVTIAWLTGAGYHLLVYQ